jgi:hypothetical protein
VAPTRTHAEDGSGAIDEGELAAAFNLLGWRLTPTEIHELVAEVDKENKGANTGGESWGRARAHTRTHKHSATHEG